MRPEWWARPSQLPLGLLPQRLVTQGHKGTLTTLDMFCFLYIYVSAGGVQEGVQFKS